MMDWNLFIACIAVAAFGGLVAGYIIREVEGFNPQPDDTEHGVRPL